MYKLLSWGCFFLLVILFPTSVESQNICALITSLNLEPLGWDPEDCRNNICNKDFPPQQLVCTDKNVTAINITSNVLRGSIPTQVGTLVDVTSFLLQSDSQVSGTLPSEFALLTKLRYFNLADNNLAGRIPNIFHNLKSLYYINLNKNNLNGTYPIQIADLESLTSLHLRGNKLTGAIPAFEFDLIEELDISSNLFTTLHYNIVNMESLKTLNISNNKFTILDVNSIDNPTLKVLDISHNMFREPLPFNEVIITDLRMNNNNFTGNFPQSILTIKSLTTLLLNNNQFSGTIPTSLGSLTLLQVLDLSNNNFYGYIPTELAILKNLTILYIDSKVTCPTITFTPNIAFEKLCTNPQNQTTVLTDGDYYYENVDIKSGFILYSDNVTLSTNNLKLYDNSTLILNNTTVIVKDNLTFESQNSIILSSSDSTLQANELVIGKNSTLKLVIPNNYPLGNPVIKFTSKSGSFATVNIDKDCLDLLESENSYYLAISGRPECQQPTNNSLPAASFTQFMICLFFVLIFII